MSPGIAGCRGGVQNPPCPLRQRGKGRVLPGSLEGELDQEIETGSHVSRDVSPPVCPGCQHPPVSRDVSLPVCPGMPAAPRPVCPGMSAPAPVCPGMPACLVLFIWLHFLLNNSLWLLKASSPEDEAAGTL